jgi:hypothetical protein
VGGGKFEVQLEGNFWPSIGKGGNWYDVPYHAIVPKKGTGANLLVPVCLSASAVAYSSTRIENMFMSVGSAAGVAAKQVVDGAVATVQDVNVTLVQNILTTVFSQRIHGPPGSGPVGPTPQYYNVSGAGSADWNGQYVPSKGTYGGYASTTCSTCMLYSYGGVWRLAHSELFYVDGQESSLPTLTGWTVANGTAPAPTFTRGPL